jgi:CIC family chloride channel protein
MWRRKAVMTVVVRADGVPRAGNVLGLITKEHVADSVAESIKPYSAGDAFS